MFASTQKMSRKRIIKAMVDDSDSDDENVTSKKTKKNSR